MPDRELTQAERDRQTALKCAREGFCLGYRMGSGYTVSIPNLEPGTEGLEVCLKSRAVEAEQREGALREALAALLSAGEGHAVTNAATASVVVTHWSEDEYRDFCVAASEARAALATGHSLDEVSFMAGYLQAACSMLHGIMTPGTDSAIKYFAEKAWKATGAAPPEGEAS